MTPVAAKRRKVACAIIAGVAHLSHDALAALVVVDVEMALIVPAKRPLKAIESGLA
jgi:hypothetical protein